MNPAQPFGHSGVSSYSATDLEEDSGQQLLDFLSAYNIDCGTHGDARLHDTQDAVLEEFVAEQLTHGACVSAVDCGVADFIPRPVDASHSRREGEAAGEYVAKEMTSCGHLESHASHLPGDETRQPEVVTTIPTSLTSQEPSSKEKLLRNGNAKSAKVAPADLLPTEAKNPGCDENNGLRNHATINLQRSDEIGRKSPKSILSMWRHAFERAKDFCADHAEIALEQIQEGLVYIASKLRSNQILSREHKRVLIRSPEHQAIRRRHLQVSGFNRVRFDGNLHYEEDSLPWQERCIDHKSKFGNRWFCARVTLQIYTMFRFPYRMAFGPKQLTFPLALAFGGGQYFLFRDVADYYADFLPDLFFIADIFVNCFLSFYSLELDECVIDVHEIRRRYFRVRRLLKSSVPSGWLDICGILPFHVVRNIRSMPELVIQLASIPRLTRIIKLFEWFGEIEFDAHVDFRVVALCKFLLMLFGMAHWVGCLWWLFARVRKFDQTTWVAQMSRSRQGRDNDSKYSAPKDDWRNYQLSLYWGFSSMTSFGYSDIIPDNGIEIIFATTMCLVQLAYNAYILGTLFRCAVIKDEKSATLQKTMKDIEDYAVSRRLPSELVTRIRHYIQFVANRESASQEHVLKRMPPTLVAKIAKWQHRKLIESTNIFDGVPEQYLTLLVVRLRARYLQHGDILFKLGDMAHELCFIQSGVIDEFEDNARRRPIRSLSEGILGELAFFMGISQPSCVAASTHTDVVLQSLSLEDYEDLLASYAEGHSITTANIMADFNLSNTKKEHDENKKKAGTKKDDGGTGGGDDHRDQVRAALAATLKRRQDDSLSVAVEAASEGDIDTIRRVVQQGLDVNTGTLIPSSASLLFPTFVIDFAADEILMITDESLDAGDYDGRTMLHLAAAEGNVKVARLLLEEGADASVGASTMLRNTVFHDHCCDSTLTCAVDRWNQSPLHDAVQNDHQQVAHLLSTHGGDLHYDDPAGVLCNLVAAEDFDGLKNNITFGTPPDSPDYDGRTALHLAAFEGNSNFISWLIQSKANVNAVDRWGNTPLVDAVKNLHELPAKILFEAGSTLMHDYACSLLCDAALRGDAPFLQLLHECGTDVQDYDYDRRTALHLAAAEGQLVSVDFLIFAKANIMFKDRWGNTAIDDAIRGKHYEVARLLQGVGAEPSQPATEEQRGLLKNVDINAVRDRIRTKVDAQQRTRRLKPHIRDLINLVTRELNTGNAPFARRVSKIDQLSARAMKKAGHEAMAEVQNTTPEKAFAMPDLMREDTELAKNQVAQMDNQSDASGDAPLDGSTSYVPKGFAMRRFLGLEDIERDESSPPISSVGDEDEAEACNDVGNGEVDQITDQRRMSDPTRRTSVPSFTPVEQLRRKSSVSTSEKNEHPLVVLERNTLANSNRGSQRDKLSVDHGVQKFTSFNQIILLFPTIEKGFELLRSRFEHRNVKSILKDDMFVFLRDDLEFPYVSQVDVENLFMLADACEGAGAEAESLDFVQLILSATFAKLVETNADEAARMGRDAIYACSLKASFSIINAAFELLDTNGKGQISIQELKLAIGGELKFGDELVTLFARRTVIRRLDFMVSLLTWLGLIDEDELDTLDDADMEANVNRKQGPAGQFDGISSGGPTSPYVKAEGQQRGMGNNFVTSTLDATLQSGGANFAKDGAGSNPRLALTTKYLSATSGGGLGSSSNPFGSLHRELALAIRTAHLFAVENRSVKSFLREIAATLRLMMQPRQYRETFFWLVARSSKENVMYVFNDIDRDFSGTIDLLEFETFVDRTSDNRIPRYKIYEAFCRLSINGVITLDTFKEMWEDSSKALNVQNAGDSYRHTYETAFMIIPGSFYDAILDLLQLCAAIYLSAAVPYAISFYRTRQQIMHESVIISMYLADLIVWLSIARRFLTAYRNKQQKLVTNLRKIRRHYFKQDFSYDIVSALPFDLLLWLPKRPPYRTILWARMNRLLRARDIYRYLRAGRSEINDFRGQVDWLCVTLLLTLHILACSWQHLTASNEMSNYQTRFRHGIERFRGYGSFLAEQGDAGVTSIESYLLSLFWVTAVLVGMGAGDLTPSTSEERWFAVALFVLNLSVLAYVLGMVSSLFMSADARLVKLREDIAAANSFIDSRDLPREIEDEIRALSNFRATSRLTSDSNGNDIFRQLSKPLQIEVASYTSRNLIKDGHCFQHVGDNFLDTLSTMLQESTMPPETVLFRCSDQAKTLYLVSSGRVDLVDEDGNGGVDDNDGAKTVMPGAAVAPIPFFFNVRHTFGARTYSHGSSRLYALDRDSYKRLIKLYPDEEETISHNVLDDEGAGKSSSSSVGGSTASGSNSGDSSQHKDGSQFSGKSGGSVVDENASAVGSSYGIGAEEKDGAIENIHKAIKNARSKKVKERVAARCAAAAEGKLEDLKQIVEQSRTTSIDESDYDQRTPLHLAASEGHKNVVLWLIENGASVSVRDRFGNTPMHDAMRHHHDQVVGILREAGAQLELTEADTASALCAAAYKNDLTEIKRLVENHVDPNSGALCL